MLSLADRCWVCPSDGGLDKFEPALVWFRPNENSMPEMVEVSGEAGGMIGPEPCLKRVEYT